MLQATQPPQRPPFRAVKWLTHAAAAAACILHLGGAQAADVVIDPGHGGKDPGAIGTLGKHRHLEKDIALDMSLQLGRQLKKQGFSVAMTRSNDVFHPLKHRLAYARKNCRKLFASVHVNSAKKSRASGVHTYVARKAERTAVGKRSLQIAQNVQRAFNPKDPAVRRAGFMMLKNTSCPTVQLEMYYMSNPADLKRLADKRQRHAIAGKLATVLGKSLREKPSKAHGKASKRKAADAKQHKAAEAKRKAADAKRKKAAKARQKAKRRNRR